jgi:hypothetical protein
MAKKKACGEKLFTAGFNRPDRLRTGDRTSYRWAASVTGVLRP